MALLINQPRLADKPGFPGRHAAGDALSIAGAMQGSFNISFKEWAVVVDALGRGEQILILRKGGIRERHGRFHVDHHEFWLFPTQYHEAESSIIPSKRPALREIAAAAVKEFVDIQYYAVADSTLKIGDPSALSRLQGRHIWSERILQERFQFGREPGLHVLLTRVYRRPSPARLPMCESYAGCQSWVELEEPLFTEGLTPVLTDAEYNGQRDEIRDRLSDHALADS